MVYLNDLGYLEERLLHLRREMGFRIMGIAMASLGFRVMMQSIA
jgi:hypothetical protein